MLIGVAGYTRYLADSSIESRGRADKHGAHDQDTRRSDPRVLALVILGGRTWGWIYRALGRDLLGAPVAAPPPFTPKPGLLGSRGGCSTPRMSTTNAEKPHVLAVLRLKG
jgi:hypothetical protein